MLLLLTSVYPKQPLIPLIELGGFNFSINYILALSTSIPCKEILCLALSFPYHKMILLPIKHQIIFFTPFNTRDRCSKQSSKESPNTKKLSTNISMYLFTMSKKYGHHATLKGYKCIAQVNNHSNKGKSTIWTCEYCFLLIF